MRDTNHIAVSTMSVLTAISTIHYGKSYCDGIVQNIILCVERFFLDMVPEKKIFAFFFAIGMFALYLLGSVWPDTDNPYSGIGKIIYIPLFKHHTWMHAIYIPAAMCAAGMFLKPFLFFGLGMIMHEFFDSFSYNGNMWFYPLPNKHHFLRLYRTSCFSEYVFVAIAMILMAAWSVFCWMDVIRRSWIYVVFTGFLCK